MPNLPDPLKPDSALAAGLAPARQPQPTGMIVRPVREMLRKRGISTLRYLLKTEAHTYAFSVAANAILSFFPFMLLLMVLVRNVFHSEMMFGAIERLLRDQLPEGQDFVVNNLKYLVGHRHRVQIASVVMLLITSNGVFLPLEVAFNRIWGFAKNRSYLGNQFISLLLAFACGTLALLSVALAAGNQSFLEFLLQGHAGFLLSAFTFAIVKVLSMAASVTIFFLIYWLLPNGKVPARAVLPAAVAMGVLWELAKYAYILLLPYLNFREMYGPFVHSVTLMFWAFISGLMVLAGAHLVADPVEPPPL